MSCASFSCRGRSGLLLAMNQAIHRPLISLGFGMGEVHSFDDFAYLQVQVFPEYKVLQAGLVSEIFTGLLLDLQDSPVWKRAIDSSFIYTECNAVDEIGIMKMCSIRCPSPLPSCLSCCTCHRSHLPSCSRHI